MRASMRGGMLALRAEAGRATRGIAAKTGNLFCALMTAGCILGTNTLARPIALPQAVYLDLLERIARELDPTIRVHRPSEDLAAVVRPDDYQLVFLPEFSPNPGAEPSPSAAREWARLVEAGAAGAIGVAPKYDEAAPEASSTELTEEWARAPRSERLLILHAGPDERQAAEVERAAKKAGLATWRYQGRGWANVGAGFATAGWVVVLDSQNARKSPGLYLESRVFERLKPKVSVTLEAIHHAIEALHDGRRPGEAGDPSWAAEANARALIGMLHSLEDAEALTSLLRLELFPSLCPEAFGALCYVTACNPSMTDADWARMTVSSLQELADRTASGEKLVQEQKAQIRYSMFLLKEYAESAIEGEARSEILARMRDGANASALAFKRLEELLVYRALFLAADRMANGTVDASNWLETADPQAIRRVREKVFSALVPFLVDPSFRELTWDTVDQLALRYGPEDLARYVSEYSCQLDDVRRTRGAVIWRWLTEAHGWVKSKDIEWARRYRALAREADQDADVRESNEWALLRRALTRTGFSPEERRKLDALIDEYLEQRPRQRGLEHPNLLRQDKIAPILGDVGGLLRPRRLGFFNVNGSYSVMERFIGKYGRGTLEPPKTSPRRYRR